MRPQFVPTLQREMFGDYKPKSPDPKLIENVTAEVPPTPAMISEPSWYEGHSVRGDLFGTREASLVGPYDMAAVVATQLQP